jgi:hypothetical protein
MKFLIIAKARPIPGMSSAIAQATMDRAKAQLKSGIIDCFYTFAGGNASCVIINADSAEALQELVMENPGYPFLEHETHPLADGEKFMGKLIEGMKKQGL